MFLSKFDCCLENISLWKIYEKIFKFLLLMSFMNYYYNQLIAKCKGNLIEKRKGSLNHSIRIWLRSKHRRNITSFIMGNKQIFQSFLFLKNFLRSMGIKFVSFLFLKELTTFQTSIPLKMLCKLDILVSTIIVRDLIGLIWIVVKNSISKIKKNRNLWKTKTNNKLRLMLSKRRMKRIKKKRSMKIRIKVISLMIRLDGQILAINMIGLFASTLKRKLQFTQQFKDYQIVQMFFTTQ